MPLPVFDVDAMLVGNGNPQDLSIHLEIKGEPMVQQRHRARYLSNSSRQIIYDPSSAMKRACKQAMRKAISELGVAHFPFFPGPNRKFTAKISFFIDNPRKDNDNLQKFILDVMEGVIYANDAFVFDIVAKKRIVPASDQFTSIEVHELVGFEI
jgi:Holliday junction resolvase RusA-like endonuclease